MTKLFGFDRNCKEKVTTMADKMRYKVEGLLLMEDAPRKIVDGN